MQLLHTPAALSASFDEPNLLVSAGLVPAVRPAERVGLPELAAEHLSVPGPAGANAEAKVMSLVAGMAAGADSIDDLSMLRHGATGRLFTGIKAPSTLGTFLRGFTFGHVRQLDAVASGALPQTLHLDQDPQIVTRQASGIEIDSIGHLVIATHSSSLSSGWYTRKRSESSWTLTFSG